MGCDRSTCDLRVHFASNTRQDGGVAAPECDYHHMNGPRLAFVAVTAFGHEEGPTRRRPRSIWVRPSLHTGCSVAPTVRSGLFALEGPVVSHGAVHRVDRAQPSGGPVRPVPLAAAAAVPLWLVLLLRHGDLSLPFLKGPRGSRTRLVGPTTFVDSAGGTSALRPPGASDVGGTLPGLRDFRLSVNPRRLPVG